ncbi:MAG TPA: translocation/assembly module TamB domain-containing protein [Holophaga sp.]|nr:translocation/assembly module TamB domain-containing protein [Holophaga sp.]
MRRLTYLLVSGAVAAGAGAFLLTRPSVDRWIVARLDEAIRRETALPFTAERLEVHPFQGRFILHGPALGGDLFRARRVEVEVDYASLLRVPHLRRILVDRPEIVVDARRLSALRLRERPPSTTTTQFRIDRLEVVEGSVKADEPAWGLDQTTATFSVDGRGRLTNQLWLDVRIPTLATGRGPARLKGEASLKFRATDKGLDTANIRVRLGDSSLAVLGSYAFPTQVVNAEASGGVVLQEALQLVPGAKGPAPASGILDFKGRIQGPVGDPSWSLALDGRRIAATGSPLHPGTLRAAASGSPGSLALSRLSWESADGRINGEGSWTRQGGTRMDLAAEGVSLAPAAVYARTDLVRGLTGRFKGTAAFPSPPWAMPDLEKVTFTGSGQFLKEGHPVGTVELAVADRQFRADRVELQLPEAGFRGRASAALARRGLGSLEAEGEVRTDAAEVADVLRAWKVTDLDMSGAVTARATMTWAPSAGVLLEGRVEVEGPRWHGAHADRVRAAVALKDGGIAISAIQLEKGEGRGAGDIRITWGEVEPGEEAMDMCFTADRLPVKEGLKAADQGHLDIDGTATGWARLHGPLRDLVLEASFTAENGRVYGLSIPAASGDYFLDLQTLRMRVTDVRVADSPAALASGGGALDLRGSMTMDTRRETWTADMAGRADTAALGLPGPAVSGQVKARLDGPITAPLGPSQAPEGTFTFTGGSVTLGDRALEGLEASLTFRGGRLDASAGLAGTARPLVVVRAAQVGDTRLAGDLDLRLSPESADMRGLLGRFTQGFVKDLDASFAGNFDWRPGKLAWEGSLDRFQGSFEGFQLTQARPATFSGDAASLQASIDLDGRTLGPQGQPSPKATQLRLGGRMPFSPSAPMSVRLEGEAELANVKALVDHLVEPGQYGLLADMKPAGTATLDLLVGGTPAVPTLDGRLSLAGGRLSERTYPQSIENLDFTAHFKGREVTIPQEAPLRGVLAQGALTAWGRLGWGFQGLTSYDFSATLDEAQFRDLPEGFEIQGSFSGSMRGNDRDGGLVKGVVRAKSMLYQADLNFTDLVVAGSLGGTSLALDPSDPLTRIELDLDVQMSRPWECDTNLVKLQGRPSGTFRIAGSLARPGLRGRMDLLPGGRITNVVPAGDVILDRGSITFPDPAVFNPVFDVHGHVDVDPYLVTLDITGSLDAINARPTSTPALRPEEIFAILVDPSAVSKVGTAQGVPSQAAVNTGLFNQGAGLLTSLVLSSQLERLRKTLTLDRVNFAYTGATSLSVTLEKSFELFGRRTPLLATYKQEGTQTTITGNVEWRFGNLVLQLGARQTTGGTLGDTSAQGVQPSGEIRYTWTPK